MPNTNAFYIILELFHTLIVKKKTILLITLVPTVLCVFLVFMAESAYKAEALIKPPEKEGASSIAAALKESGGGVGGGFLGSFLGGEETGEDDCVSLLKSARFGKAVIDKFDLETRYKFKLLKGKQKKYYMADVIKQFQNHAKFELTDENAIRISMKDKSPQMAKEMVSFMIYALDSLYTDIQRTAIQRRLAYLDERLGLAEDEMKKMEDAMVSFQTRYNLIAPEAQVKLILENVAQTEIQMETLKEQMELEATLRGTSSARYKDLVVQRELLSKSLRSQLRSPADSNTLMLPAHTLPALATEYFRLERAYTIKLGVYKYLVQQVEALKLEANRNIQVISVIDPAWVDEKRVSPKRRLIVEAVFILSFILSTMFVVLKAAWKKHKEENPEIRRLFLEIKQNLKFGSRI